MHHILNSSKMQILGKQNMISFSFVLCGKNEIHTTAVVKLTCLGFQNIYHSLTIEMILLMSRLCIFFPKLNVIHALVIRTSLFVYFHEYYSCIVILFRRYYSYIPPHTTNHCHLSCCQSPSCSNSFCVLSQSAFRPHTHISIAYKVRCTSLHFIPLSLSIHPSLHLHREISSSSPLGCWFSCKSCDFCIPNFVYLLSKASFNSRLELTECSFWTLFVHLRLFWMFLEPWVYYGLNQP